MKDKKTSKKGKSKKASKSSKKGKSKKASNTSTKKKKSGGKKKSKKTSSAPKTKKKKKSKSSSSSGSLKQYKDEAIGGGIFGVISRTGINDLVKVSDNPAAREVLGAAALHFLAPHLPNSVKGYAKDAARAGVSYAAILLTKGSDAAARIAETVNEHLPEPFNDENLLGD